jgi:hypothetical protein
MVISYRVARLQSLLLEQYYGQNWMYAVLLRVRTMKGLYLAAHLSNLSKYAMSQSMREMIDNFQRHLCTMPKRQAVVIFPEVNYELSLVMENVKRESELEAIHQLSKNRYTCIDHAYSMVSKYKQLNQ